MNLPNYGYQKSTQPHRPRPRLLIGSVLTLTLLACTLGQMITQAPARPNPVGTPLPTFTPTPLPEFRSIVAPPALAPQKEEAAPAGQVSQSVTITLNPDPNLGPAPTPAPVVSIPSNIVPSAAIATPTGEPVLLPTIPATSFPTPTPNPLPRPETTPTPVVAASPTPHLTATASPTTTPSPSPSPSLTPLPSATHLPAVSPTPTTTPTPSPSPTAILEPAQWTFSGVRLQADATYSDSLLLFGDLINDTGVAQELLNIKGIFYDAQNQVIAAENDTDSYWPFIDIIPPGGHIPFELIVADIQSAATFTLSVEALPRSEAPHQNFEFTDLKPKWEGDKYCLKGRLTNHGPALAEYLVIALILYDGQDQVISFNEFDLEEIEEKTSKFSICSESFGVEVTRPELQAWGR